MATRTVHIEQADGWVDLAAAASPALVEGKTYSVEWEERTIAYMRLSYDDTVPTEERGTKIFANNSPQVPPAYFTVPADPAKIWIKAVEKDIIAQISPADRSGDGSTAETTV